MASVEEAKEMCEEKGKELDDEIKRIEVQQKKLAGETTDLKKKLKSKFGDQIQLEDGD